MKLRLSIALLCCLLIGVGVSGCVAAPTYQGPVSDHFDGDVFRNTVPSDKGLWDLLRLGWGSLVKAERWPGSVASRAYAPPGAHNQSGIRVTYINHATVLIQVQGVNILTDPIYSQRASPFNWAGPKRVRQPGIALADLPPIDVVLISHNHYDHLDAATLLALAEQQETPPLILAGLGNGAYFTELGLASYRDMDWQQVETVRDIDFHFVECRHRSGRGISDQMKTLWGSFVIQTQAGNIYFAGDTGYGPHFQQQAQQFGSFALTILPIGAYEPRWFMADVHLNPAEAVRVHQELNSRHSLGIHFGVFQLTYEGIDQPILDLQQALRSAELPDSAFWVLEPGDSRHIH